MILVPAACESGSEGPRRAAVDPSEPCSILSPAVVEGALGTEVRGEHESESRPGPRGPVPLCLYSMGAPYSTLTVHVEHPVTRDEFTKRMNRDLRNAEPIDDLADAAYIHGGISLLLLQGETVVGASLQHFEDIEETRNDLVRIGREAAERI
ncbi:MAG: hypothetical protein M3273_03045 [Actinomycetota bacterium]|nr:hypothetical protein [Actinomycetota bacterium]